MGVSNLAEQTTRSRTREVTCWAGMPVTTGARAAGPLELQRQLKPRFWPELSQWPALPLGGQHEQGPEWWPAIWQWGQPGGEGATAASRPPGRDRTAPRLKTRIRRRVAAVLRIEIILSRLGMESQEFKTAGNERAAEPARIKKQISILRSISRLFAPEAHPGTDIWELPLRGRAGCPAIFPYRCTGSSLAVSQDGTLHDNWGHTPVCLRDSVRGPLHECCPTTARPGATRLYTNITGWRTADNQPSL